MGAEARLWRSENVGGEEVEGGSRHFFKSLVVEGRRRPRNSRGVGRLGGGKLGGAGRSIELCERYEIKLW